MGPCALFPRRRRPEAGGRQVALGARAFDLLACLVRRAGEVVGNDELLRQAWPGLVVEAAHLRVYLSTLRKALDAVAPDGGCRIVNAPLRG